MNCASKYLNILCFLYNTSLNSINILTNCRVSIIGAGSSPGSRIWVQSDVLPVCEDMATRFLSDPESRFKPAPGYVFDSIGTGSNVHAAAAMQLSCNPASCSIKTEREIATEVRVASSRYATCYEQKTNSRIMFLLKNSLGERVASIPDVISKKLKIYAAPDSTKT